MSRSSDVVVDRPKESRHPRYPHIVHPLDYGYLKDTRGGDGAEIDVWRGSDASQELVAIVCTVDLLKNDAEVKLLLGCTEEEIGIVLRFHNESRYLSGLVVRRA